MNGNNKMIDPTSVPQWRKLLFGINGEIMFEIGPLTQEIIIQIMPKPGSLVEATALNEVKPLSRKLYKHMGKLGPYQLYMEHPNHSLPPAEPGPEGESAHTPKEGLP